MLFGIIDNDDGEQIGRVISFHAVIYSIWEFYYSYDIFNLKLKLFHVYMSPRRLVIPPSTRLRLVFRSLDVWFSFPS